MHICNHCPYLMHSGEPIAPHPFEVIKYHVDTSDPTPFTILTRASKMHFCSLSSNATDPKFQDANCNYLLAEADHPSFSAITAAFFFLHPCKRPSQSTARLTSITKSHNVRQSFPTNIFTKPRKPRQRNSRPSLPVYYIFPTFLSFGNA